MTFHDWSEARRRRVAKTLNSETLSGRGVRENSKKEGAGPVDDEDVEHTRSRFEKEVRRRCDDILRDGAVSSECDQSHQLLDPSRTCEGSKSVSFSY